ncbi:MAG: PAS domain-containing methyl-accepting chemotaxis protein, partial [Gallionellaceae bacterium]
MRTNMPVTNVERHLKDDEFVVSKTDLKGQITYVNSVFLSISGFTEEELIGNAHNMVRHPDMPPAAFGDLWKTLQSGMPWRGMVKNRCKNGDYYWVDASANPIWEKGQIVGFMSLRIKPTRAQVEAAEDIYRQFREGTARGLTVKQGAVARTGLLGMFDAIVNMSIKSRVAITSLMMIATLFGLVLNPEQSVRNGLFGVDLILVGYMWWLLVSKILHPLDEAVKACQTVSSGDLKLQPASNWHDEIGRLTHAINTMAGNMASIVADVRESTVMLSGSSNEVAVAAQTLSQSTSEQAASLEETSSSLEQMSASINQNTANAKVTESMASQATKQATEGGEAVTQTVTAMKQIAGKISIVDDIAYQTNLLALNAAIEAARAGEHGKGFAVVAAEVRKLAERSQIAAQEIGELASASVEKAENAGALLVEIVPAISKTSGLVQEISAASEEQST